MASTSASSHLSYPAPEPPEGSTSALRAPSPPSPELLKNRLYVGNLHPTVDEFVSVYPQQVELLNRPRYTLIQVFSKFGKLARLDYLFHKTGALRGKPRGYAFVEYTGEGVSARHHHLPPFLYNDMMLNSGLSPSRRSAPPMRRLRFLSLICSAQTRVYPPGAIAPIIRLTIALLTLLSLHFCRTRLSRSKRQTGRSSEGVISMSPTHTRRHPTPTRTTPPCVARCPSTTYNRTLDGQRRSAY